MTNYQRYRAVVRWLHVLVVVGLPFVKINGQSVLRFDIPTLKLFFFGATLVVDEFFIVLVYIIALTFAFITLTISLGRVWCGWLCPQTVMSDLTLSFSHTKTPAKKALYTFMILGLSVLAGANMIWYFISPYEFFPSLVEGTLSSTVWGFWVVLSLITFLNFTLLRQKFCATVCPYSKLQSVLFDDNTLVIAFDKSRSSECLNCQACIKVCPVGIDIRKGLNQACVSCARCVDKCNAIFAKKVAQRGLINYFWGAKPTETSSPLRLKILLLLALTVVFTIGAIYLTASRTDIDVVVMPNHSYGVKVVQSQTINSYKLALTNKTTQELTVRLVIEPAFFEITPKEVLLPAGRHVAQTVFVQTSDTSVKHTALTLKVISKHEVLAQKNLSFNY